MDFVCKLYGNTYAVHVTVALVGVATLNLALPAPPVGRITVSCALKKSVDLKAIIRSWYFGGVFHGRRTGQPIHDDMHNVLVIPMALINRSSRTTLRVRAVFHKAVRVCHVYHNFKLGFTCRTAVIVGTLKDGSLLINTLASNICFSYRNMF